MEDVLDLYESKHNEKEPVICVDEKLYQLLYDYLEPIPINKGKPKKIDYEYKRNGTCNIFMVSEPFNGIRKCKVTEKRGKADFAKLLKDISDKYYPNASKIKLVMDNLNTHKLSILYKYYTPEEARRIIKRFEVHYTPIHGSWLNIAEIEISAMAKQSINRRIATIQILKQELNSWVTDRNSKNIGINWRFKTGDARIKLKHLYPS